MPRQAYSKLHAEHPRLAITAAAMCGALLTYVLFRALAALYHVFRRRRHGATDPAVNDSEEVRFRIQLSTAYPPAGTFARRSSMHNVSAYMSGVFHSCNALARTR